MRGRMARQGLFRRTQRGRLLTEQNLVCSVVIGDENCRMSSANAAPKCVQTRKMDPSLLPSKIDAEKSVTVNSAIPQTPIALAM